MRVIIYGEPNINGSAISSYVNAFKFRSCEVLTYSNDHKLFFYKTFLGRLIKRLNGRKILESHRKDHLNIFLEKVIAFRPDILIIFKGINFSPNDILNLKKYSTFVININHDDFFSKYPNNRSKLQFESIPFYDYIFTTRSVNVEEIRQYNPNVDLLLFAFDPVIHKPHFISKSDQLKYKCDVLFVGTYEKDRAKALEQLVSRLPINLAIYGSLWNNLSQRSVLRKYVKSYHGLYGLEMCKAIQVAKISLGFLRKSNRDDYTQRTFEIPAVQGVLLAEKTLFHMQLFEEGVEALFFDFNNVDDLVSKTKFLLQNDEVREAMRLKGFQKVTSQNHTYQNRVDTIFSTLNICQ